MTAELTELNRVATQLSPDLVRKVIEYARALNQPGIGPVAMDDLTTEEMRAESNRVMRRFDEDHPGEDWSQQPYTPGYK